MLRLALMTTALLAALPAAAETRCGWYHNPSPANVILEDADGQWWLAMQGSPPVPGFDDAYTPEFDNRLRLDYQGQPTDRYGSSCACAEGRFDATRGQYDNVLSISSLREIPLERCEADPKLPPLLVGDQ
jgi:Protein of unknown function (DUF4087)